MRSIKLLNGDSFDLGSWVLNGSHISCRVLGNTVHRFMAAYTIMRLYLNAQNISCPFTTRTRTIHNTIFGCTAICKTVLWTGNFAFQDHLFWAWVMPNWDRIRTKSCLELFRSILIEGTLVPVTTPFETNIILYFLAYREQPPLRSCVWIPRASSFPNNI